MSTTSTLPSWAADILGSTPARGDGLNRWLLRGAIALRRCGRDDAEITETLRAATAAEAIKPGEIERAVVRSTQYMTDGSAPAPTRRTWPSMDAALRQRIIDQSGGVGAVDLWERSPSRLVDEGPDAETLIDLLFPGNPLLCCAASVATAATMPRTYWRGKLAGLSFIVPSPMTTRTGRTQDGRKSPRCLGNVGPRKYLVVEQDAGTRDEQAAILLHLATKAPLVMVLSSGGKSLHGWFSCAGATEDRLRAFFAYAVRLGADPSTVTQCQLVRLPEGTRDNGKRQAVYYLNMEVMG